MKTICSLAVLAGVTGFAVPATSLPLVGNAQAFFQPNASSGILRTVSDRYRVWRSRPVAETAPATSPAPSGDFGGYVVNRYGYGNYVAGSAGYGGYPGGSAEAQIWKQRQEWKCQAVPESC